VETRLLLGLAILASYLILGTALAVNSRRRLSGRSDVEYYVGGRRLGTFLAAMTYAATTYSAFMIVGLVGFAYSTGVGALGFELAYYVATLLLLVLFSRSVWRKSRERGWVTPGDMLSDLLGGRSIAVAVGVLYLVALIPYASVQLKGIGEAVAGMAGDDAAYLYGVIMGVLVMIIWSLVAGIWSVAVTDALQGLWMLGAGTLLLVWVFSKVSSGIGLDRATELLLEDGMLDLNGFWKVNVFLAFTLPWVFFAVTNPQVVQRLFMPKDDKSLAGMIRWFGVFGLYYTVVVTLIGLLAKAGSLGGIFPLIDFKHKDQVTPMLLSKAHPLLSAFVFTSIVAAAVSTADSILLTLASSASRDISVRPGAQSLGRGVIAAILVAAAMVYVAALRVSYIVQLSVLSSLMLLPIAPVTIAAWAGKKPGAPISVVSIVAGELPLMYTAIETGSPLKAFLSTPMGVPVSIWMLAISAIIIAVGAMTERH